MAVVVRFGLMCGRNIFLSGSGLGFIYFGEWFMESDWCVKYSALW